MVTVRPAATSTRSGPEVRFPPVTTNFATSGPAPACCWGAVLPHPVATSIVASAATTNLRIPRPSSARLVRCVRDPVKYVTNGNSYFG
ncbi:hypothetical protein GCM10017786_68380 [Amycolatopsis deserti]|uniref:Uncharacterized protein n=1 Tax=Amycolatopsis deserti TaxID=185696 RepID=A0ABQ3JJ80_9PSEU|nr:hypothetical protein GCM10017786_68380 [Amycolatopsis deserti]